jgi:hypothetical protein
MIYHDSKVLIGRRMIVTYFINKQTVPTYEINS